MNLIEKLTNKKIKVAIAESCTGGGICKAITDFSGASNVFDYGVVSYSNEIKIKLLGVSSETLNTHGAVSEQCAMEMAAGVKTLAGADIGLSATGIAGPDGGTTEKPVGTVFIGCSDNKKTFAKKLTIENRGRKFIRETTVKEVLKLLDEQTG